MAGIMQMLISGGGVAPGSQLFTSSTTFTKPLGATQIKIEAVGGGGTGANDPSATGGMPGAYVNTGYFTVSSAEIILTLTIGAAGYDSAVGWDSGFAGGATSVTGTGVNTTAAGGAGSGGTVGVINYSAFPYTTAYGRGGTGRTADNGIGSYGATAGAVNISWK